MDSSNKIKVLIGLCFGVCVFFLLNELVIQNSFRSNLNLRIPVLTTTNGTISVTRVWKMPNACNKTVPLKGRKTFVNMTGASWAELQNLTSHLKPGGRFKPTDCVDPDRVAIIVPYRNREHQLRVFLQHMHPFLQRQRIEYTIFIIELAENISFNRGLLLNIGFVEAKKHGDFRCYIFHDVDLLPEDEANLYNCPREGRPRHLSAAVDKFGYRLPYGKIIGGAAAFLEKDFITLNGFSNLYFKWGGEDDDLWERIVVRNLTVVRYSMKIAMYKMIKHSQEAMNPHRAILLANPTSRMNVDGLNSLVYSVLKIDSMTTLYTRILVTVDQKNYPLPPKRTQPPLPLKVTSAQLTPENNKSISQSQETIS